MGAGGHASQDTEPIDMSKLELLTSLYGKNQLSVWLQLFLHIETVNYFISIIKFVLYDDEELGCLTLPHFRFTKKHILKENSCHRGEE